MPAGQHLLPLLGAPEYAQQMQLADWDGTLRLARQARVLGMLSHRLRVNEALWSAIPEPVRDHLQAAINYAAYRAHLVRTELRDLECALPSDLPITLLKGAAYLLQDIPQARGRSPNDVDLLVRRADLNRAEIALKTAGWQAEAKDAYDERYYREWSHELPPLRYPGHPLEVDLHHTIAPITSQTRADDKLLFSDLRPITGSRFLVLCPADQIIHAIIHLFQDSELDGELRGLVDIDALLRTYLRSNADWQALIERAHQHQATRLLWYALHYCHSWLKTPIPMDLTLSKPPIAARVAFDWTFERICPPRLPDTGLSLTQGLAAQAAKVRYHSLRMPPALLAQHLLHKGWIAVSSRHRGSKQ
ncbi:MAG: nucleotidyltransferase family protein [Lamprobacter sp.]|uniref:nucleotidyltransferase domain-containing protein n=1 Tax=Lamprobacter sp. TaxID=3100796 RepID=UPI002B263BB0|nr:nucleotidyltransferase family protein [Lamprobacter sp.]MEA3642975.1 nucleotidyltransferase family protein [Lamprobacter sp.]